MKKLLILISAALVFSLSRVSADEGMWLLPMLEKMNIKDMAAKGFKLSAKDIYDINGNSIKDAIVIFGGGCTGEIVSADGLLFTNHHCGYGAIQNLSSVEHDYLKNGFWAMNRAEELPAPGLSVTFIRHIEDVTDRIIGGLDNSTSEEERAKAITENIRSLIADYSGGKYNGMSVNVREFFGGNQYFAFATEIYRDVRLVGAPPSLIGKFGGDTDNWMWPRHTGDFSIFRVYSDAEGRPAEYSADNVPYQAPSHLKVSLKGFDEGDFAMIMGFPGSTSRYMTSWEIDQVLEVDNPNRIYVRGVRQDILKKAMLESDEIRIKYASKYASSSNYWKNSIGMNRGLTKLNVKEQKKGIEEEFTRWTNTSSGSKYSQALPLIREAVTERIPYSNLTQYLSETVIRGIELVTVASFENRLNKKDAGDEQSREELIARSASFYKDYEPSLDREVAKAMLKVLRENISESELPDIYSGVIDARFNGDIDAYVDYLFDNSVFTEQESFEKYVRGGHYESIGEDPAVVLRRSVVEGTYNVAREKLTEINRKFNKGHRLFIAGLLEIQQGKMHYPDANFTIRLTYGNILPYSPADAVIYDYYTTLAGVITKEDPANPSEFTVPEKLKELFYAKDYGPYANSKGELSVCFLSNNDITGGNSGSPVLNDRGELIGLAFDGNWEAISGDIAFEPDLQRCINVDVRYVLFIIDKFAGAGYLLDEMTIVR